MLAAWQPNDPQYKEGAVLINVDHEVLREQITNWQAQYPDHYAEAIENEVIDVYGQIAVSKIAHSEHFKGIVPSQVVEKELRSDAALTMALLGLMAEESVLATRIGGKFGREKEGSGLATGCLVDSTTGYRRLISNGMSGNQFVVEDDSGLMSRETELEPATTRSLQPTSSAERTLDPKLDPNPKTGYLAKFPKTRQFAGIFVDRGDRI